MEELIKRLRELTQRLEEIDVEESNVAETFQLIREANVLRQKVINYDKRKNI